MQLYNSLSHKKEEFVPNVEGKVNMYTCGPTVYHYAHIGNLRSYIMEDILEKALRFEGYEVNRVMNIPDVGHLTSDGDTGDDKMLKGAKREHKTVMEIAKFYTDAFFGDCEKLNIKKPDTVVPATTYIDEFIRVISTLMDKGYAYEAGGNIYFDTSKLDKYYVFNDFNEEDEMALLKHFPLPKCQPYLARHGMTFVYQPYEIAPYSAGAPQFTVPFEQIKPFLSRQGRKLIQKL